MKYKMTFKVKKEVLFDGLVAPMLEDYEQAKGVKINAKDLYPGFSYSAQLKKQDEKQKNVYYAAIKVLKFDYPNQYRYEYRSNNYFKIGGFSLTQDGKRTKIVLEEYKEALKHGVSKSGFKHDFDSDPIKTAGPIRTIQYFFSVIKIKSNARKKKQDERN